MSFDRNSNFNREANFTGVKFGENKPVLEVELNELQEIQNEARADIVRDSIPSGFVQLGELDYDYMLNNENCVKLKTDSVAYVNGYKIKIPKDTIINIGKAPEKDPREDLVFLEVWKEEVTKDSILTKNGGEGQVEIPNNIRDSRYPVETSRRVALKWRIRHVTDVDFTTFNDGLVGCVQGKANYNVQCQGGNEKPLDFQDTWSATSSIACYGVFTVCGDRPITSVEGKNIFVDDVGVLIAGTGTETSRNILKTLDGYSYAIPMFRLYRKPSCGKAIPFEYQKINPKVDYSKFTALMKEEKVERVTSENIQGRSLVNLMDPTTIQSVLSGSTLDSDGFITLPNGQQFFGTIIPYKNIGLKPNTKYTLIRELNKPLPSSGEALSFNLTDSSYQAFNPVSQQVSNAFNNKTTTEITKVLLTTKESLVSETRLFTFLVASSEQDGVKFRYTLLEGDWTNKPLPKYFRGLKSVGEDDSLITVKTGILNESSYDPSTGTPKLNTISGANHISSDNLIIPTIEGQVKRGEVKVSDLTSFGKVDSLVGDEIVDFTMIQGRTLENCVTGYKWKGNDTITVTPTDVTFTNPTVAVSVNFYVKLKPSTKYTLIFSILNKSLAQELAIDLFPDTFQELGSYYEVGTYKKVFTTESDLKTLDSLRYYVKASGIGTIKLSYPMIIEGDHTNTPLDQIPYIEGIKSVGENENNKLILQNRGSNLLTDNNWYPVLSISGDQVKIKPNKMTSYDIAKYGTIFAELEPGDYVLSSEDFLYLNRQSLNGKITGLASISLPYKFTVTDSKQLVGFSFERSANATDPTDIAFGNNLPKDFKIKIEKGTTPTKWSEYKQEITLKEPLRSLPNGICDIIEGNKVIRRVGKYTLTGSEFMSMVSANNTTTHLQFNIAFPTSRGTTSGICNNFALDQNSYQAGYNNEGFSLYHSGVVVIRIAKSKLATPDIQGMKTWLIQNPTTCIYELSNPVEELIEPNYDKESIKTYQLTEPLRSLPNGVKDEIVGNTLIRRCGEIYLKDIMSTLFAPTDQSDPTGLYCYIDFNLLKKSGEANVYCDKLPYDIGIGGNVQADLKIGEYICGYSGGVAGNWIYLKLNKNKLTSLDSNGMKKWIQDNNPKLIYELTNPIEIPLKEVLPSQLDTSYERQFRYFDKNYLLELPNGKKDVLENGKVTRNLGKIVLDGSESWAFTSYSLINKTATFALTLSTSNASNMLPNSMGMSNRFPVVDVTTNLTSNDTELITNSSTKLSVRINRSKINNGILTSDFKAWLQANPIHLIYELKTPVEEYGYATYCPYPHSEDNTYCGSMYLGDGTNDTYTDTLIKSESVIVNTPFRESTGKLVVNDCKYKKNNDGYATMYENLFDGGYEQGNFDSNSGAEITHATNNRSNYIKTYPNTNYCVITKLTKLGVRVVCYDKDKQIISVINNVLGDFTTPNKCAYIRFTCDRVATDWSQILLIKGSQILPFKHFNTGMSCFENTEINDIEDLRHKVSLTGFNYEQILNESFDKLLKGEL